MDERIDHIFIWSKCITLKINLVVIGVQVGEHTGEVEIVHVEDI